MRRLFGIIGLLMALAVAGMGALVAFWPDPDKIAHAYFEAAPTGRAAVIAHRGGAGLRPENTLAAFDAAMAMGADVLEADVRRTADGALVLLHDETLERTTDATGAVADLPLAQVRRADAGAGGPKKGADFSGRGLRVPTLAEAFEAHPQARWVLEIKPAGTATAQALCAALRNAGKTRFVLVGSFHHGAVTAFRAACPEVATSMSSREVLAFVLTAWLGISKVIATEAVALQIPPNAGALTLAHGRIVNAAKSRGLKIQFWTINDPQVMDRLLTLGADGLITDMVPVARDVLANRGLLKR